MQRLYGNAIIFDDVNPINMVGYDNERVTNAGVEQALKF